MFINSEPTNVLEIFKHWSVNHNRREVELNDMLDYIKKCDELDGHQDHNSDDSVLYKTLVLMKNHSSFFYGIVPGTLNYIYDYY